MYGKDDRSKDNRKNMKQHKYYHKQQQQQQQQQPHRGANTSSSSPQTTAVRSIVDVADSSDEPRFARKGWSSGTRSLAPQKNRDMLDTLPPTDTDDVEHMVDGTPIDENARAQLRAGDYKQMSQFSTMGGGHFTFGAEKEWNSIAEGQTQLHTKAASSYFTLNLSLLNAGLQTIPFYKRMDYATNMFTRQQIVAMNEAAERAELTYQARVLRESNGAGNGSAGKSRAPSAKSVKDAQPPAASVANDVPDELDELLALTDTQLAQTTIATAPAPNATSPLPPVTPTSASKNEVEQWLDSVLDE